MPQSKKPKATLNAGALLVVDINGVERRFSCTGVTVGNETPEKVIKKIQDCVRSAIAKATKIK